MLLLGNMELDVYMMKLKKIIKLGGKFRFNETIIGLKHKDKKITKIISTKRNYNIMRMKLNFYTPNSALLLDYW